MVTKILCFFFFYQFYSFFEYHYQGCQEWVQAMVKKISEAPSKGRQAKNLHIKSERLTVSC